MHNGRTMPGLGHPQLLAQNSSDFPPVVPKTHESLQPLVRMFIGPMPARTAEQKTSESNGKPKWWLVAEDDCESASDGDVQAVPERVAFRYFLHNGGREEEWDSQDMKIGIKREMSRIFRDNAWSILHSTRAGNKLPPKKWIGSSFKIGEDFFGVPLCPPAAQQGTSDAPVLKPTSDTSEGISAINDYESEGHIQQRSPLSSSVSVQNNDTSTPASSEAPLVQTPRDPSNAHSFPKVFSTSSSPVKLLIHRPSLHVNGTREAGSATEITSSGPTVRSPPTAPLKSALQRSQNEGPERTVKFKNVPPSQLTPVPPSEVLARPPAEALGTRAGAVVTQSQDLFRSLQSGSIIRKERMLVRRSFTRTKNINKHFNEEDAAKLRDLRCYDWQEFLVVWRKDRIELYDDYSLPGKERLLGHKHLACVIPLSNYETRISLYSFVDFTFCLTCRLPYASKDAGRTASSLATHLHFHDNPGYDIFVFKTKTRSAAVDWFCMIWKYTGGEFPSVFEVYCPIVDTRIRLRIPESHGDVDNILTKDKVIEACQNSLNKLPSWGYLIEPGLQDGVTFQLCWRRDAMLDWIHWERDVEGVDRPWAVIYGLALTRPRALTHLELRMAKHCPEGVGRADGSHLHEPAGIEGYLYSIRPTRHARFQVYLATHKGFLFSILPQQAHPPRPPLPTEEYSFLEPDENGCPTKSFGNLEVDRGAHQVMHADFCIDLRSIAAVRRAFQQYIPNVDHSAGLIHHENEPERQLPQDDEDEGGDEVLAKHPNKSELRIRRSFELLLRSGHVIRYETYSCRVAQEWVERLSALIHYWSLKHRADAAMEMDISKACLNGTGPLTAKIPVDPMRTPPVNDPENATLNLPSFWNWCAVAHCFPVICCGQAFVRRKLRGQYSLMQLFLVSGHLVQFHMASSKAACHLRSTSISLLDSYVSSGHYATQSLPIGEFSTTQPPLPRLFPNGFENDDPELDTMFLIWYRPHAVVRTMGDVSSTPVPSLKASHKVLIVKARSKLERDSWCWALNTEIERLTRKTHNRELKSREGGFV